MPKPTRDRVRTQWILVGSAVLVVGISIWTAMSLQSPDFVLEKDGSRETVTKICGLLPLPTRSERDPHIHTTSDVRERLKIKAGLPKTWSLAKLHDASIVQYPGSKEYSGTIEIAGNPSADARALAKTTSGKVDIKRGLITLTGITYAGDVLKIAITPLTPTVNRAKVTVIEPN